MDPVHGPLHGPGLWTTPEKNLYEREREVTSHLTGQFQQLSLNRQLKNLGGTHDHCDVRMVGRTGQFFGLVCSGEGLDELNECRSVYKRQSLKSANNSPIFLLRMRAAT